MLKKLLLVGAAAALLLGLFFGRDAVSYVSTSWKNVKDTVRNNVPIDFELQRARTLITNLDPQIERNVEKIAREEVEVDKLVRQVEKNKQQLAKARDEILKLNDDLQSGTATFVYAGRPYTADQVRADLKARFDRFKNQESTTDKLEQILAARQKGLDAARAKVESMLSAKRDLEVTVADLEARLKLVEVHKTENGIQVDDGELARTQDLVEDIRTRVEVAEKMVNAQGKYDYEINLDPEPAVDDITDQITDYFGTGREQIEALVSGK